MVPIFPDKDGIRSTVLKQRKGKGIWQNLWEFPLLETELEVDINHIEKTYGKILKWDTSPKISLFDSKPLVHKLSHQHLNTKFWILETEEVLSNGISVVDLEKYPVPVLIADFIKAFKF